MGLGVKYKVRQVGDQQIVDEIHKVVVHRFQMGDVEDPDIYVADPLLKWQKTDQGKFIMENSVEQPSWSYDRDILHYGYNVVVIAELEKKKLSEFYLRWGKPNWK